jgi:putative oxidoreductase
MNTNTMIQSPAELAVPVRFSPFDRLAPFGWPLARITTGLMLIPHGAQKLFGWFGGHGLSGTGQFFETALGMSPGMLWAGLAGTVEVFGGLALVLGLLTRPAALAVAVLMAVALTVHLPQGLFWTEGGIEVPLMWGAMAVAVLLRGGGEYSLDAKLGLRI